MMRSLKCTFAAVLAASSLSCSGSAPAGATLSGPILLAVDATDVTRKVFHVSLKFHVGPGPLTLVYPKWIPGEHGPTGPVTDLVGLKMSAGGKPVDWCRDDVDMYAFHVSVPTGTDRLDVSFDFLSALGTAGFSSAASVTPHLAIVTWNQLVLYPEGVATDNVQVEPSLRIPRGWQYATALKHQDTSDGEDTFAPVSLTTLVDSPVLAGEHFVKLPLDTSAHGVELDVAADSEAALKMSPEFGDQMKRLVAEADALFGARHFNDYHFLFTLSDEVAHFGLEHHQSNDTRQAELAMVQHNPSLWVLAHEFTHSWNGKYRRPAGLATPDFQAPMKGELLWVYEGLTQYIGMLLAARSGLIGEDYYREHLAASAAYLDHQPGRVWRPLVDTTVTAQLLYSAPKEWASYRRGVDFYDEGWLIWLDADTKIRELTHGQKSLDDFCKRFYGGEGGAPALRTYALDDVVTTMNDVAASDWKTFFQDRVMKASARAPLEGVARAGWRLAYNNARNKAHEFLEAGENKQTDASYSLGLLVGEGGKIVDVMVGSPAYAAGLGPGMKLVRVNGKAYSPDVLRQAILADALSKSPMIVDVGMGGDKFPKTLSINYHEGLQEPHLERAGPAADVLHEIVKPHAGGK
jgi:predicted metalloprotease with PDZ domain